MQMLQDEGVIEPAQILGNVLTRSPIREQVLEMHHAFNQQRRYPARTGIFALMSANALQALKAEENLSFLLMLW